MSDSVTLWVRSLKEGDAAAVERLWERYFARLVGLARVRLGSQPRRMADEEDVALSAFDSLCRGAARGQFGKLSDRENLWALLVVITSRKAADAVNFEKRAKRGGEFVRRGAGRPDESQDGADLQNLLSREPSPEFAVMMIEQCECLLSRLEPDLRRIAMGKLEGRSNQELAAEFGCGLRTIERRLDLIRRLWDEDTPPRS